MYVEPNTTIRILKGCPLDTTYNHTIFWENEEQQTAYFSSLTKHLLTKQTYTRLQKGIIRVSVNAENLYDCNYLMFQNAAFGNKWFYAFIKGVEYYNNGMSEITFEIDVMQTWFFNYTLQQCFVEREHAVTDTIGSNTVPENLETGPYVTTVQRQLQVTDLGLYIMVTEIVDEVSIYPWKDPGIVGGFPTPCYWMSLSKLSEVSVTLLKYIVDAYAKAGKSDAIIAIFTCPYNMVSTTGEIRTQTFTAANRELTTKPKNNKLYTYPYCCLAATALGQGVELRYELFSSQPPKFTVRGGFGANMQVACTPNNYAGRSENLEYMLSIKDFPICAWVSDYFQNWLAQNKASLAVSTVTSVGNSIIGAMANSNNVYGLASSIFNAGASVARTVATVYEHSIIPDQMTGSANAADIAAVSGISGFYTMCKCIRPEYIRIIDEYFTMYGYATHRVKYPNRNSRPHWNYVKTSGCVLTGSVPADDIVNICKIYDNGITFWKVPSEIGNYSLDNSPA